MTILASLIVHGPPQRRHKIGEPVQLLHHPKQPARIGRVLRLDALLGIIVTGIVFVTVLAGLVHHPGISVWVNAGFHYFAPWFAWPLAWALYTFVRGAITGWYPYPPVTARDENRVERNRFSGTQDRCVTIRCERRPSKTRPA